MAKKSDQIKCTCQGCGKSWQVTRAEAEKKNIALDICLACGSREVAQEVVLTRARKRKPNGAGSVYKLSGRRSKPWVARVTTGWSDDDQQLFQVIGYFETSAEAEKALVMHKINPVSPRANMTLGDVYEEWARVKYDRITDSTKRNYLACWSYLSRYGNVPVRELRAGHVQAVLDAALADGKSKSHIEKIKAVAVMLGDYAVQNDIVQKNYAQFSELPKLEKKKKDRFSDLEVEKIWAIAGHPWADTVLILIYSGLRLNEMLGLTRFNVDLTQGVFAGAGLKTDAGRNRTVPIPARIAPLVRRRYEEGSSYLIETEDGSRVNSDWYRKRIYYPILELAGVRKLSPHCCRHTYASRLAEAGVPATDIQAIMGHASFSTTADNYVHSSIDSLRAAVARVK